MLCRGLGTTGTTNPLGLVRLVGAPLAQVKLVWFFVAGFGVLWRVSGMSSWCHYAYCYHCCRPFKSHQYRLVVHEAPAGAPIRNGSLCLTCDESIKCPNTERKLLIGSCVASPLLFAISYFTNDMEMWSGFYAVGITSLLLLIHLICFSRMRCKPIYDRWVMQHGTDPDNWPDATKPN